VTVAKNQTGVNEMKARLSTLALIAALGSSFAFAGEKAKSKSAHDDANPPASQESAAMSNSHQNSKQAVQKTKKKHDAKPEPTEQEKQFDEMLRGMWG
jgi:hypothetical protein